MQSASGEKLWYEDIPGIDAEAAIENSGSEEGLRMVMRMFCDSIMERADEIAEYYDRGDWENYTIKVHALKSSLRIIGLMEFAEKAEELELAGKAQNLDLIREKTGRLLSDYMALYSTLSPVIPPEEEE